MSNSRFYILVRPFVSFVFKKIYRPTIIGQEKIPEDSRVVLAGNHKHNFDCLLLLSSTERPIHFLAKIELFKGLKKIIFNNLGLIPIDRKRKNHEALALAIKYLQSDHVVGLFPEGTFNRTKEPVMPFKIGAVKMAYESNSPIVPFVITGDYKWHSRNLKIEFLDPFFVGKNLNKANDELREKIKKKLEE